MARRLKYPVHLTDPETGRPTVISPDDELPGWAAEAITNPDLWVEVEEEQTEEAAATAEAEPATEAATTVAAEEEPAAEEPAPTKRTRRK